MLSGLLSAPVSYALDRRPYGSGLSLRLPYALDSLDPHSLWDPAAALFGSAVTDTLFLLDTQGRPYPSLAEGLPEALSHGIRVKLRPGLTTAKGKALNALDLEFSLRRSQKQAGLALLHEFGSVQRERGSADSIVFEKGDPTALAHALSSPVTAIVPRGFSRLAPDGTGAFAAFVYRNRLLLKQNLRAARGPAFLTRIEAEPAADLADALRAFEAGEVDVGWLGMGLHRPRKGAIAFDAGLMGWVTLRTGHDAGNWGAPGVAQQLVDGVPQQRLKHLGLKGLGQSRSPLRWGGPKGSLLVASSAPQLVEVARTLTALLSQPQHELKTTLVSDTELERLRKSGRYMLMLDFVRCIGPEGKATAQALLSAAAPELAQKPPRLSRFDARSIARSLSLGVVGELRIAGAHMPSVMGVEHWELGNVWRPQG